MGMLLACEDGLLTWADGWQRLPCPLRRPVHVACEDAGISAVDNAAHLLWHAGQLLPCPHDVEALLLWQGNALVLSSNTDCISIADDAGWRVTARAGMYPQGMCLHSGDVLICGGADGLVHRLTLPELLPVCTYALPGMVQRIHAAGDTAHVLSLTSEEPLQTLLCRLDLTTGRARAVARLPGIPGAVCTDGRGGAWVGATEHLYHFQAGSAFPDQVYPGLGLPTHLALQDTALLATDPIAECCLQLTLYPEPRAAVLWQGEISQACFG